MSDKTTIEFISRAYPPIIGGIENQNKAIYDYLSNYIGVDATINKHGKKVLPVFLPWAIFKSFFNSIKNITLLGDGVLAIIPWVVKKIKPKKKYICIVHGLDITHSSKIYQKLWIETFFASIDHFIAVSHNTKDLLIDKGISSNKITVIPNGFDFSAIHYNPDSNQINSLLNIRTENKTLLLTLGRLVKRKGVKWFIKNVMTQLDPTIIYIVAGDGPELEAIQTTIKTEKLSNQVKLLGQVSHSEKEILFSNCNLFIQPNIKIKNNVEGFGICVIEASAYNLPVITANLEGLKDAIHENKNGWLVTSEDSNKFIEKIQKILENPEQLHDIGIKFKHYSQSKFDWNKVIPQYLSIINEL